MLAFHIQRACDIGDNAVTHTELALQVGLIHMCTTAKYMP